MECILARSLTPPPPKQTNIPLDQFVQPGGHALDSVVIGCAPTQFIHPPTHSLTHYRSSVHCQRQLIRCALDSGLRHADTLSNCSLFARVRSKSVCVFEKETQDCIRVHTRSKWRDGVHALFVLSLLEYDLDVALTC